VIGVTIKVGVVGLGIGQRHLMEYSLLDNVQIVGAADVDETRAKEIAERFDTKPYFSLAQMIENEDLDAVSICTPPKPHLELTKLAAENKIHILCEKPMAPKIEDCERMIEACEKNGVKLMLGFKKRFAPAFNFVKEHFEEWGRPFWAFYKYPIGYVDKDWFWASDDGRGPTVENTVHSIDMLRYLLGEVDRIYAEADTYLAKDRAEYDSTVFTFRFKSGAIAAIGGGCSSIWGFTTERLAIHLEKAVAEIDGALDRPSHLAYRLRKDEEKHELNFENADGFKGEIEHFISCIINDEEPRATGQDGLENLRICLAVSESATKNAPVEL